MSCRENCSVRGFFDVLEDLGFCRAWITEEEDVDISADGMFPVDVFWNSAEKGQRDCRFNVVVAIDTGRN